MDELKIIATAIETAIKISNDDDSIVSSYNKLKNLLIENYSSASDIEIAISQLEKKPNSQARREMLYEELELTKAHENKTIIQQAKKILDLIKNNKNYEAKVNGSGAIAQGDGAVASGERGVAIGGDVDGSVIITGDGNAVLSPKPWPRKSSKKAT